MKFTINWSLPEKTASVLETTHLFSSVYVRFKDNAIRMSAMLVILTIYKFEDERRRERRCVEFIYLSQS